MDYPRVDLFLADWKDESDGTSKVLAALTDASLKQEIVPGHRTLGRIAWHVVTTIPEMMGTAGLPLKSVDHAAPVPAKAAEIAAAYDRAREELARVVKREWSDDGLRGKIPMYGFEWTRGFTLGCLIGHQAHHRGQMTVLMRQAGLRVPGFYGPAKEDWAAMGVPAPEV